MQTGEVAKALGVHYNTAYNLAATGKVQVSKGDNGQYDWTKEHLTEAKKIMASRGKRTRRPATGSNKSTRRVGGVAISTKRDKEVLSILARSAGQSEQDYLRDLLRREAESLRETLTLK